MMGTGTGPRHFHEELAELKTLLLDMSTLAEELVRASVEALRERDTSKAQAVISVECHSPLIALHNGTPTFYVRQPTDTCKGQMYRDFGANEWFFEIDETSGPQLWSRLEAIHKDPAGAKAKVKAILATVEARQKRMVDAVRQAVSGRV